MQIDYLRKGYYDPKWPVDVCRTVAISDTGLVLGKGTCLARLTADGELDLERNQGRLLALLSVTYKKPISRDMLRPVKAAAYHWSRGEKALANLRLVFANLPPLADPHDAYRLSLAEYLLDHGMTPRELMKELGLDPAVLDLEKYNPAQPRVPAGNGQESERWGPGGGGTDRGDESASSGQPHCLTISISTHRDVQFAANGPLEPGGIIAIPLPSPNPLDPQHLNKEPPTPRDQQAIVDTLNKIRSGTDDDIKSLYPHSYQNLPHKLSRAILPPSTEGFKSYNVFLDGGRVRGEARLVVDQSDAGHAYYTNNHYRSFYLVNIGNTR